MLIPEVPLSEFKKLKTSEIQKLKSCAITSDGDVIFFAIIPPLNAGMTITDHVRIQAEYMAQNANSVGGKELEEVKGGAVLV